MANLHISVTFVLALCLKLISSSLYDLIETPQTSHILGEEDKSTPNIVSNSFITEVPKADNHLTSFEREINDILGTPGYIEYGLEDNLLHTLHHTHSSPLLPEKEHKYFTMGEGGDHHHQHVEFPMTPFERDEQSAGYACVSDIGDVEDSLVKEVDHLNHKTFEAHNLKTSKKPHQTSRVVELKKNKRKDRSEDADPGWSNSGLNDKISSKGGVYLHDILQNHYKIEEKSLIRELQWQAQLVLWHSPGLSATIKAHFQAFEDHSKNNLANDWKFFFSSERISVAIKRIHSEIAMGFFGALKTVCYGQKGIPEMRLLVEDGWDFLYKYFHDEFQILQKNNVLLPSSILPCSYDRDKAIGEILSHVLTIPEKSSISSRIIFQLLKRWYQSSKFNSAISRIPINYSTFLENCHVIYNRGRKKIKIDGGKTKKEQDDLFKYFRVEMRRQGESLIQKGLTPLGKDMKTFFATLKLKMGDIYVSQDGEKGARKDLPSSVVKEDIKIINKAIEIAEKSITPTFMGILSTLHTKGKMDESWSLMIQSGWNHLQTYFNRWISFLSKPEYSVILPTKGKKVQDIDWADDKMTIAYLGTLRDITNVPTNLVWFLLDLWFDCITESKHSEIQNLSTKVLPPNREFLRNNYMACVISHRKS
ncbi:uncharacterized protein MELLADRAFT_111527 [Melampsora larici-populina 98AG31]|uniref:Secreted protein n=1 Tax=Melampsora larici-populina (strain 98AG31 / pathotype 3-4-7) TaxID=747676 RepID=F4S3H1_MELLP|nr:uncharacterized protein MELLADRAFT_111527 [Melampsora larici-populina 98AG31]EGG00812.1 hypothetical protein MELLADRAFT_111527 [Melampsora larici-populina 98AG31]